MAQKVRRADLVGENKVVIVFNKSEALKDDGILETECKGMVYHKAPHTDLQNAFLAMIPHLMFGCQLAKPETFRQEYFDGEFLDDERFEGITVTGILMVGKDYDSIKLIGRKTTTNGDVVALNSPIISLVDESDRKYPVLDILRLQVADLLKEVALFQKGKYGAGTQVEMQMKVA